MNGKNQNIDKCYGNSESIKNCAVKMLKSPSNIVIIILTYMIWSMLGMSYSSNQNFDMVVTPQYYVMLLSFISILVALINYNTKLVLLAMVGAVTVVVSLLAIVTSKIGVICLGYPIGYYALCPMSIFLFLLQIKQITCFAWCQYCEVLKSCKVSDIAKDSSDNFIKEVTKHDPRNNKQQNSKK